MIRLDNVAISLSKRFSLAPITLEFAPGTTTALIGPSGCGKSTVLKLIAGLIAPDSGSVFIGESKMHPPDANSLRRRMGYVIQEGGLFPHLTIESNVCLVARYLRYPAHKVRDRLGDLIDLVALPASLLARFPWELSGGQRQRVALMRALMLDPQFLLLDEPLGALDPITRNSLQQELKRIFGRLKKTTLLVTHDMGEAAYLADEIVLMRDGQIVQRGTLRELIDRPAEAYVTDFISAQRSPLETLSQAQV